LQKPSSILLNSQDISHNFDYPILENISLSVFERETIAIMGVSGSGKSTLLHILATLLQPLQGFVEILGKKIYELDKKELLEIRRKNVGFIFQSHYLFRGFSAQENLEISSILSERKIEQKILERFDIEKIIHQNIGTLSGGQQQRVSIARILTKKPKIIFADEPTGNLDKESAHKIIESLVGYVKSENAALIVATHDLEIAKKCDVIFTLKNGRLHDGVAI